MENIIESLESVMSEVSHILTATKEYKLEVEVLSSALLYIKENPSTTIEAALIHGYYEWIK